MLPLETTNFKKNELRCSEQSGIFLNKLRIATGSNIYYINVKDIIRIQSISNYSKLFFLNGQTLVVSKVLAYFEQLLSASHFSRIHRTHLVNLNYLEKYVHGTVPQISMSNNELLPVSRRKKKMVQQKMMLITM